MSVTAFGWAAIHGAGASALLPFLPAAIGLLVLWAGYFVITRTTVRRLTPVFGIYALATVVASEAILPFTPLKLWRTGRAASSVEVRSVTDELLLSARGNPIGIRIIFEAVVPRTGEYSISASGLGRVGEDVLWPLNFGRIQRSKTEPPPAEGESIYGIFQKGVVYTFVQDMTPSFLSYDEKEQVPCLLDVRTKYISEEAFLAALAKSRNMKYRGNVLVSGPFTQVSADVKDFVTREYDVAAMYRTIAIEGNRRCES
ncbi:MAG TPA: hypothetical protein VD833_12050 [Vicinamibacterales bacterium]|nr:hypothetical protein [Vicinamibacterales bacterium]